MTSSIENAYSLAFMKMISTYDKEIVTMCQFYMGKLPMEMEIGVRRLNFLSKFVTHDNIINHVRDVKTDIDSIALKFNLEVDSEHKRWNHQIWDRFANSIVH